MLNEQYSSSISQLHLLQLVSPNLPIGAFTYSQGLENAVERGWVKDVLGLEDWLTGLLQEGLAYTDIPLLKRIYEALNISCVPIALNSGKVWPKHGIVKHPGKITVSFLKPIEPGLNRDEFIKHLEMQIYDEIKNIS